MSPRLRFAILSRDHFTCRYCGRSAPDVELQVDHVLPVAAGGTDSPENLVAACWECNQGKRDLVLSGVPHDPKPASRSFWAWQEEPFLRKEWEEDFAEEPSSYWNPSDIRWWILVNGPYVMRHEVRFAARSGKGWAIGSRKAFGLLALRCDIMAGDILRTSNSLRDVSYDEAARHYFEDCGFDAGRLVQRPLTGETAEMIKAVSAKRKQGWVAW